jgi:hypothetical protein
VSTAASDNTDPCKLERFCIHEEASSGSLPPVVSMIKPPMRGNETNGADGSGLEETGRIVGASFSSRGFGLRDNKRCNPGQTTQMSLI